jgi:hypothetical protein
VREADFPGHLEYHVEPARKINVCRHCHTLLHMKWEESHPVKPCSDPNCLLCRLGVEEFCRLVALKVLRDLECQRT